MNAIEYYGLLLLSIDLCIDHGANVLPRVHEEPLRVVRVELPHQRDAAGNEGRTVDGLTLRRLLAEKAPWKRSKVGLGLLMVYHGMLWKGYGKATSLFRIAAETQGLY